MFWDIVIWFGIVWLAYIVFHMGWLAWNCIRGQQFVKWDKHLTKQNEKHKERRKRREWHVLRED